MCLVDIKGFPIFSFRFWRNNYNFRWLPTIERGSASEKHFPHNFSRGAANAVPMSDEWQSSRALAGEKSRPVIEWWKEKKIWNEKALLVSENWRQKKKANLYVLLMFHINVILKCESRRPMALTFSAPRYPRPLCNHDGNNVYEVE